MLNSTAQHKAIAFITALSVSVLLDQFVLFVLAQTEFFTLFKLA